MAAQVKFTSFSNAIATAAGGGAQAHDLNADTFRVALTNTAPTAGTDTQLSDITQITAANGYTAGGEDITNAWSVAAGVGTMTAADVTFTASGGSIGPFRYAVLYNDTATNDELCSYLDYGSAVTVTDGNTFVVDFGVSLYVLSP